MTYEQIVASANTTSVGHSDDLGHLYCCCSPDVGVCGADIAGTPEVDEFDLPCVVCEDLIDVPCRSCGLDRSGDCWCGECE